MPPASLWISAFCAFLLLYQLGDGRPPMFMEYYYLESVREMVSRHDWITPFFNAHPRFDKPILFYWLMLLSTKLFGSTWPAARFVSSASAMGVILLTYYWGKSLLGRAGALRAVLILATTPLFVLFARTAIPDLTLTFFITLALFAFWRGMASTPPRPAWLMLSYAGMALATLTKGPIGVLLPALIMGGILAVRKDRPRPSELCPIRGLLLFFALLVPWFVLIIMRHGQAYIDYVTYILHKAAVITKRYPFYFYIERLFVDFLPWSLILVTGWKRFRKTDTAVRSGLTELLIWSGVVIAFFSVISLKAPRYLLPMTPAFSLLTAWALERAIGSPKALPGRLLRGIGLLSGVIGLLASGLLLAAPGLIHTAPRPPLISLYAWSALIGIASMVLLFGVLKDRGDIQAAALAISMGIGLLGYYGLSSELSGPSPATALARRAETVRPEGAPFAVYHLHSNEWVFAVGPPVAVLETPEDLHRFLEASPRGFIVMKEGDYDELDEKPAVVSMASRRKGVKWNNGIEILEERFYLTARVSSE